MGSSTQARSARRYQSVTDQKAGGATYTPSGLATFVAEQIVQAADFKQFPCPISILDPAVGDGALLMSLLAVLRQQTQAPVIVYGFDTNPVAVREATCRINASFPEVDLRLERGDFLDLALGQNSAPTLFSDTTSQFFDLVVANPPYVRTQIIGASQAQRLASSFGLTGRVDLYHAFLIGISQILRPGGTAGIIVSNRFMTTRGGASVRDALRSRFDLRHIWDLGDTKLFEAAVLPAVILANGRAESKQTQIGFTSIYETTESASVSAPTPIEAIAKTGTVALSDGRRFRVQHGTLHKTASNQATWRIATETGDSWLATVAAHSWGTFQDIGKVRVGVKTCADKIFIRSEWGDCLELLRALTTHHGAARFRAISPKKPLSILYPHASKDGRRYAVNIDLYPKSKAYLETHRAVLEARSYVLEGGRKWYEIWVPQDPAAWEQPKLVFRDISVKPTFWMDLDATIVNGDCYWMIAEKPDREEMLWLAAAVANSTFIEAFYDHRFHNKLYAGRRRFMSQYVEQFPLPDPTNPLSCEIVALTKRVYEIANTREAELLEQQIDRMVWLAFGLPVEEVAG